MDIFSYIITFFLSCVLGYSFILLQFKKDEKIDPLVCCFLSVGIGLGLSSFIIFYTLLLFDHFNRFLVVFVHLLILGGCIFSLIQNNKEGTIPKINADYMINHWPVFILGLLLIPICLSTKTYPQGGWDAWQVWNYKAKFIFAGGDHWKNVFDSAQWRTSPHYPLLLPLINVWHWTLAKNTSHIIPFLTSIVFTFMTGGLLYAALKGRIKNCAALAAPLFLLSLPFFVLLATSQYCDIVFAYYLLAALFCLMTSLETKTKGFAVLSGVFLGCLAFSKSEGTIAALLIGALSVPYFLWADRGQKKIHEHLLSGLITTAVIALIPTLLFKIFYSPGNQTFVNGLFSAENPSTLERFQFILKYFSVELRADKWNNIWILLGIGLVVSKGRCLDRPLRIFPLFLIAYIGIVGLYYYVNTQFKIDWWMNVTLNRILFALLPTAVFWVFYSLRKETAEK